MQYHVWTDAHKLPSERTGIRPIRNTVVQKGVNQDDLWCSLIGVRVLRYNDMGCNAMLCSDGIGGRR